MPKAAKKFYAVCIGRNGPNIYSTWDECREQTARFPGAIHKSFPSRKQAEEWLASKATLHINSSNPSAGTPDPLEAAILSKIMPSQKVSSVKGKERLASPLPNMPEILLSSEQQMVLDRVKQGRNVFFTGSAGTGKSVLLREIIRSLEEFSGELAITASTGIAAVNIGGSTLHSWAGIGLGEQPAARYIGKFFGQEQFYNILNRWQEVRTLIIDEISMIDGSLFDKLELIARSLRHNNEPFGGIQLILSGDFCQLPPVPRRDEKGQQITPVFAFDADTWDACVGPPITLTRVFRQKDQAFVDILNAMRFGQLDYKAIAAFGALSREVVYNDGIEPTELFPTRQEVERANTTRLKLLDGESHVYQASEYPGIDSNGQRVTRTQMERLLERLVVPRSIQLKVGAQVMLIKNLIQGELVNGSVGQIVRFSTAADALKKHIQIASADKIERKPPSNDWAWPVVRFIGGREIMCIPQEFTITNADGGVEARRDQIPLILAWALSVHKSQGQTLERVKVDLKRTFENGQAYVALSRATSLEQLQVLNFDPSKVTAHPRVIAWHFGDAQKNLAGQNDIIDLSNSDEEIDREIAEEMLAYYDI